MLAVEKAQPFYLADDPVHGFDHVLRVTRLAEQLAQAEGADLEIVQAAALLHDGRDRNSVESSCLDQREDHHEESARLAAVLLEAEGWSEDRIRAVQHCIRAHRFRDDTAVPLTIEAKVLFDADKLDAIGAVGAARAIAYAVKAGQPFYARLSPRFILDGTLEPAEAHSAYHEFHFKLINIKERLFTASAQRLAEERQRRMLDFFRGLAEEVESAGF